TAPPTRRRSDATRSASHQDGATRGNAPRSRRPGRRNRPAAVARLGPVPDEGDRPAPPGKTQDLPDLRLRRASERVRSQALHPPRHPARPERDPTEIDDPAVQPAQLV